MLPILKLALLGQITIYVNKISKIASLDIIKESSFDL